MSKFKIGDRVKRLCAGDSAHPHMHENSEHIVSSVSDNGWLAVEADASDQYCGWCPDYFELVPPEALPVRTVTRLEIVPGTYGYVDVSNRYGYATSKRIGILIANHGDVHRDMGASELRAAARVFLSLADALEDQP